jgi:hypothetical protein
MFVCCVCCRVEVSATSCSLVWRSPTDCGASLCVIKKPRERGRHSPCWAAESEKSKLILLYYMLCPRILTEIKERAILAHPWSFRSVQNVTVFMLFPLWTSVVFTPEREVFVIRY